VKGARHGHPSGDANPSPEDPTVTHRLFQAGLLIAIADRRSSLPNGREQPFQVIETTIEVDPSCLLRAKSLHRLIFSSSQVSY
jgi:hypothetical protein